MRRVTVAGAIAALVMLLMALPAAAAEMTGGCSLEVRSFDENGQQLDQGSAPGVAGTASDPFQVDLHGKVDFLFRTGSTVFQNNHWDVRAQDIPILSGSDDNPLDVDETGTVEIASTVDLPFDVVGVFFVSGDLHGNGDTSHCHGEGWVALVGDPVGSIPWLAALALLAIGAFFLVATPYSTTWETDPNAGEQLHSGPLPMG